MEPKKRKITVSSGKAKGRRLQDWTCEQISKITGIKWGKDELIAPREMGQTGTDVRLIGIAKEKFPFAVECKNCEGWSIPGWIDQAKANKQDFSTWLLICKRNRHDEVVVMDADFFFDLYEQYLNLVWSQGHKVQQENQK